MLSVHEPRIPAALRHRAEEPELFWRSGPWSAIIRAGSLDDLRFGDRRVLRAVRCVIRDENWGTPEPQLAVSERAGTLHIRGEIGSWATWTLVVQAGAALTATATVVLREAVPTNRAGLLLLHHPDQAGTAITVRHPDGTAESVTLPDFIAPHQPVLDIAGLSWAGIDLDLDGDVWEMEDQRNWTDASFKTYSTPLAVPFPVTHPAGTVLTHTLTLTATDAAIDLGRAEPTGRTVPVVTERGIREIDVADPLPADLGDVHDLRVTVGDESDVAAALPGILAQAGALERIGVVDRAGHLATPALVAALREVVPADLVIVGGTRAHFTELGRAGDLLARDVDELAFSITPFMHESGGTQLWESLDVQPAVLATAELIADATPLRIGPVTLTPRFNAVATGPGEPAPVDPRTGAPELAAWVWESVLALGGESVAGIDFDLGANPAVTVLVDELARVAGQEIRRVPQEHADLTACVTASGTLFLANRGARSLTVAVGSAHVCVDPGAVVVLRESSGDASPDALEVVG